MANQTFFYDPSQIVLLVATIPISGFQDGEMLAIAYEANLYEAYVGADGDTTRARILNSNAKMTIKLAQSSRSNDLFSALINTGGLLSGAADVVPILVKDLQGTTLFVSAKAWIEKIPDTGFDKTIKAIEWPFYCSSVAHFIGGSIT